MDAKKILQKYHGKLVRHAILKSVMLALVPAFAVLLVTSAIWWFFGLNSVWICALFAILVAAVLAPILYRFKFRPTIKNTARSVDALGLEERLITMTEFEGQSSVLIDAQRKDAVEKIATVSEKLIKFAVPVVMIVMLAVTGVLGLGMTAVAATSEEPLKDVIVDLITPEPNTYELVYEFEGDGDIVGEMIQFIQEGKAGSEVTAVPADGWMFVKWSDGVTDPYRFESRVMADTTITAIFEIVEMIEDAGDAQDAAQGMPSDKKPQGETTDSNQKGEEDRPSDEGKPQESGEYLDINKIIDGETYYGNETYDNYYEDVVEELTTSEDISEEESDVIEKYFETIRK